MKRTLILFLVAIGIQAGQSIADEARYIRSVNVDRLLPNGRIHINAAQYSLNHHDFELLSLQLPASAKLPESVEFALYDAGEPGPLIEWMSKFPNASYVRHPAAGERKGMAPGSLLLTFMLGNGNPDSMRKIWLDETDVTKARVMSVFVKIFMDQELRAGRMTNEEYAVLEAKKAFPAVNSHTFDMGIGGPMKAQLSVEEDGFVNESRVYDLSAEVRFFCLNQKVAQVTPFNLESARRDFYPADLSNPKWGTVKKMEQALALNEPFGMKFSTLARGGILVLDVEPNSPAARAGMAKGDLVLQIDALPLLDSDETLDVLKDTLELEGTHRMLYLPAANRSEMRVLEFERS